MNKNNILLSIALSSAISFSAPISANTMLGAFVKYDGWSLTDIDKFNTDTAKPMAVTTLFTNFDMHWDSLQIQTSNIVSRGATPVISLMPYSKRYPDMLAAITSGEEDVYINSWIQSFKAWRESYPEDKQPSIMLRFGHEFNGNWYPWGNNPEEFKATWRYMHAMFEAAGVNEGVEWVWCASATDVDDYNDLTLYYPGADVVDWTSLDGYNWGSNYAWTSWRSFDEVFSSAYVTLVNNFPEKPILIAEVGSAEPNDRPDPEWGQYGDDSDASQSKEVWVSDMMQRIKADYPAIRAISWFNINKELSWALNETARSGTSNTGLNGYNQEVMNGHFVSDFLSAKAEPTLPVTEEPVNDKPSKGKSSGKKGGGNSGENKHQTTSALSSAANLETPKLTGLQRALANNRMPEVVGEKLRQREAEGFRNLSAGALKKIRQQRLEITQ